MKKLIVFLSLFPFALSLSAQSYEALWKDASEASEKDLPKTALQCVEQIRRKALAERNDAQLLKAALMGNVYGGEISPDTSKVCVERMEQALAAETRPVPKALWHSALARIYASVLYGGNPFGLTYDELNRRSKAHLDSSLLDVGALAQARAKDWLPLFKPGEESRYFNDDLLHVLLQDYMQRGRVDSKRRAELYGRVLSIYRQQGSQDAVLMLTLDSLALAHPQGRVTGKLEADAYYLRLQELSRKHQSQASNVKTFTTLVNLWTWYDKNSAHAAHNDSLLVALARQGIALYGKSKEAGNAHALRNFLLEAENPTAELNGIDEVVYPGSPCALTFRVRNLTRVQLRITKLYESCASYDYALRDSGYDQLAKLAQKNRKQAKVHTYAFSQAPAWAWQTRKVDFAAPAAPGVYYAELLINGKPLGQKTFSVSAVRPLVFSYAPGCNRVVVVDSRTGKPVSGAKVAAYPYDSNKRLRTYTAAADGTVNITLEGRRASSVRYYAFTDTDRAAQRFYLSNLRNYGETAEKQHYTRLDLFTDRAIYRPGQEVGFSGVAYTRQGDSFKTEPGFEAEVFLYNANYKKVDSLLVRTDEFGSFSGRFRLPASGLPGGYRLEARSSARLGTVGFKVEEYKRPTFTAETQPLKEAYKLGDTVQLKGEAKTYSGIPVGGARVQYTVARSTWFRAAADEVEPQNGETLTDASGQFVLPVRLAASEEERLPGKFNRYFYHVQYTVTAENGETAQGSATLSAATRAAWFEAAVPATLCKERLSTLNVKLSNALGENIPAQLPYIIRSGGKECLRGTLETGKSFRIEALAALPSGKYSLELPATHGAQADTVHFVLFAETDRRPANRETPFFSYERSTQAGDSAFVLVGTPEQDAVIHYDLLAGQKVLESRRYALSDSLLAFHLNYRPEYGDGATAFFAMVRDGKMHRLQVSVRKPEPDKRLVLTWKTFRSRLTPGQQEEWRLAVAYPDGTPADARLAARMYDASLDAFAQSHWAFTGLYFSRFLPAASWAWTDYYSAWPQLVTAQSPYRMFYTSGENYTHWRDELFSYRVRMEAQHLLTGGLPGAFGNRNALASLADKKSNRKEALAEDAVFAPVGAELEAKGEVAATSPLYKKDTGAGLASNVRTNFAETAFFQPALRTDEHGEVSIAFTLPESMTQWNFTALAHDRKMNYGRLDTTLVARKEFMVEPALPRFVRRGDRTALPVKVTNLTDKAIKARLTLTLADALASGAQPMVLHREVELPAGESRVYSFDYEADTRADVLVCRAEAVGGGFSDGEEHYLPILSDLVEVTRTLPFSMPEKGKLKLAVDTLFHADGATHRSLTVELSSNPTWYAVSALPVLAGSANSISAVEWATRFYALALGERIAQLNPEIASLAKGQAEEVDALSKLGMEGFTDETPWLQNAQRQQQRAAALGKLFDAEWSAANRATALDKLKTLQQTNGAWSWYPGMPGSNYITVDVALLLARVQRLAENYDAQKMLHKATDYLRGQIAKEVEEMKKTERRTKQRTAPTEWQLRYLYLLTVRGEKFDSDASFLLDRAATRRKELTMYGKAVSSVVLAENGKEAEARLSLESLLEHTVANAEMGRWFDTPRAEWSWSAYRIPTQCAAIEALAYFGRDAEADAMRLWLLQAKRTQMWETSRATADAVYALLSTAGRTYSVTALSEKTPVYYTLYKGSKIVGLNARSEGKANETVGYHCKTYTEAPAVDATSLRIDKRTDGLSWGSVYATFTVPASEVKTEGKGLKLLRRFEVKRGNDWVALTAGDVLKKGDRVRQLFTLTADRDYDFVALEAARPACLEPARPLSGYQWADGLSAYRVVRDAATEYYIEQVRKGTHTFSEELFVDRAGLYGSGISRIRSVFAPEFAGTAASVVLTAE